MELSFNVDFMCKFFLELEYDVLNVVGIQTRVKVRCSNFGATAASLIQNEDVVALLVQLVAGRSNWGFLDAACQTGQDDADGGAVFGPGFFDISEFLGGIVTTTRVQSWIALWDCLCRTGLEDLGIQFLGRRVDDVVQGELTWVQVFEGGAGGLHVVLGDGDDFTGEVDRIFGVEVCLEGVQGLQST